jgi:PIN domain nuclease of toxin-antitoxin system
MLPRSSRYSRTSREAVVQELLETATISSVNWSEVVQKALEWKTEIAGLRYARLKVDKERMTHRICYISAICHSSSARKNYTL